MVEYWRSISHIDRVFDVTFQKLAMDENADEVNKLKVEEISVHEMTKEGQILK